MGTTSADRHGELSSDQAHPPRATTYEQAQDAYLCTSDARERYEELANRDVTVRAFATLQARGTYDPERHGDAREYAPLTADEHLEILAAGEVLARHYRHPAQLHRAVQAGASWPQIAAATGSDEAAVRHAYREWADGQRRLHIAYEGEFGLNAAEHSAALHRAAEPEPERAPHGATPDRNRETGLPGPLTVAYAPEPPIADDVATTATPIAEPLAGPRLCAHADRDGKDAHWLAPGTTCQAEPSYEPEAGE